MRQYGGVAVWAAAVAAVVLAGLVLSSRAPGGELEPPGPPAKSMHTLDEIYANTASVVVPPEALATPRGPVYLYVQNIQGGATEGVHKDWIAIFGSAHEMELPTTLGGGGQTSERVTMAPLTVVKQLDKASPKLALVCCRGTHISEVKIEWVSKVDERQVNFRVTLNDVLVSRISPRLVYRGDGFVLMEEVSFSFAKITWEYDGNQGPGDRTQAYWDLRTNQGG